MKRYILSFFLSIFLSLGLQPVFAQESLPLQIVMDGKRIQFPDAQPEVQYGHTMVPIGVLAASMGASVTMNGNNQFSIDKGNTHMQITWNSYEAKLNNRPVTLDVAAYIKQNRTYVPLRFVSEAFHATVGYDKDNNTIYVDTFNPDNRELYEVKKVDSGDTFEVTYDHVREKVRLIGVDAPEMAQGSQPAMLYSQEAYDYTSKQLTGKQVYLVFDQQQRDIFGRLLAYVYLQDGTFYNAKLVKDGYARIEKMSPNGTHDPLLLALLQEARQDKKGIWSQKKDPWNGNIVSSDTVDGVSTKPQNQQPSSEEPQILSDGNVKIAQLSVSGESVLIVNNDDKGIDMTGWKLVEWNHNRTYTFPDGFILESGKSVRIVSGPLAMSQPPQQLLWTKDSVWENRGDKAILYNKDGAVKSSVDE